MVTVASTHNGLVELGFDFPQQPVEGLPAEPELLNHAPAAERGAQVDVEEQGGVLLGLPAQRVVPVHNHQLLAQLFHAWEEEGRGSFPREQQGQVHPQLLLTLSSLPGQRPNFSEPPD